MSTTETPREAAVNYAQEVLDELTERLPDCDTPLLELYALLALVRGGGTTLENVHDAWAIWRNRTRPDHPSLVPFIMLAPDVRELDRKYAEAIRESAAELVLGGAPDPEPSALPAPGPLVMSRGEFEAVRKVAAMLGMDQPAPNLGERPAACTCPAEAKLAKIEAHCRLRAEWASLHCPDLGRPAEALVKADAILAIIGSEEEGGAVHDRDFTGPVL